MAKVSTKQPQLTVPKTKRERLIEQKNGLIAYIYTKIEAEDWHAVQDAASDIREIEAKLEVLG